MSDSPPSPTDLPPGFTLAPGTEPLSVRGDAVCLKAIWREREVCLRIGEERQTRAELELLSSVDHPGLAQLLDHGFVERAKGESPPVPFVAREWIEGRPLSELSAEGILKPEELGAIVCRLGPALDHLHGRGFVHGDLKADNVICTPDGRPILTDFGLARRTGDDPGVEGVSGSLFAIAPEVLRGLPPDARSDLFSLGALLHELIVGHKIDAREFYARFPRLPFLEAAQTEIEAFPEWSRDIVQALLAIDPAERPRSAIGVARSLAARLGLDLGLPTGMSLRETLRFPVRLGREDWIEGWIEETRARFLQTERQKRGSRRALAPQVLTLPAAEDRNGFLEELRLRATLARVPAKRVDLRDVLKQITSSGELDRFARSLAASSAHSCLFLFLDREDLWAMRAIEMLARAATQVQLSGDPVRPLLLVRAEIERPTATVSDDNRSLSDGENSGKEWEHVRVPDLTPEVLTRFVEERIDADSEEERREFAAHLHGLSGGAANLVDLALGHAVDEGWIQEGDPKPRLRHGAATAPLLAAHRDAKSAEAWEEFDEDARLLIAALTLREDGGELATVANLCADFSLDRTRTTTAVEDLRRAGALILLPGEEGGSSKLMLAGGARGSLPELPESSWDQLHKLELARLDRIDAPLAKTLPHRLRLDSEGNAALLTDETTRLRERGLPELVLDLLSSTERFLPPENSLRSTLALERALTWIALGEPDRARETAKDMEAQFGQDTSAQNRAAHARLLGQLSWNDREFERALEYFEQAGKEATSGQAELLFARARLLFESGRDAEARVFAGDVERGKHGPVPARLLTNFRNILAMSAFRLGRVSEAIEALRAHLAEAQADSDAFHEAGVRINLATCLRRTGELDRAIEHLEAAERLYEEAGYLPGIAQTRAQLGGALREAGRLSDAEPLLSSALEMRERLGDRAGAAAARGMLGLLHAESGRPRAALDELRLSWEALHEGARARDAEVLLARLDEQRARLGIRARSEAVRLEEQEIVDPRVHILRARAHALRGRPERAREMCATGAELGRQLGRPAQTEEAEFLLRWAPEGGGPGPELAPGGTGERSSDSSPLIAQDEEVMRILDASDFDADRARLLAELLARRGRSDRACRLFWAIRARCPDRGVARACGREGDKLFAEITRGLGEAERTAFGHSLTGLPDAWPSDLTRSGEDENGPLGSAYGERELELFLAVSRSLMAEGRDLRKLLGTIVESALALTGGKRGFVALEEDGEIVFDAAIDSRRGDIEAPEVETSESVIRQCLNTMRPLRISSAIDDPELSAAQSVTDLDLRSILCFPFRAQDKLRGVIYVDHQSQMDAFDERSERLLAHLGHHAALAVRHSRSLHQIADLNDELSKRVAATEADLESARDELRDVKQSAEQSKPLTGLVGNSGPMNRVSALIERAAPHALPVLVIGPSGTGKEVAARALHALSIRAEGPFVSENCASIPESLVESEFFGYRKGAFTGAVQDRAGMFERADSGTIFLDEIGELTLDLQAKLLRVLETSEVRRLGGDDSKRVDFRLVAATNRDLEACVAEGTFREDLYYRLDALRIEMPPLAERVGDIPALVEYFMKLEEERGGPPRKISKQVMAALCSREWPGNVRELQNEVRRLCVMSDGDLTDPTAIRRASRPATPLSPEQSERPLTLAEWERRAIEDALERNGGDKQAAADQLGTSRAKIYQRLRQWKQQDESKERS